MGNFSVAHQIHIKTLTMDNVLNETQQYLQNNGTSII